MSKQTKNSIFNGAFLIVCLAICIVFALGSKIFPADHILANIFNGEVGTQTSIIALKCAYYVLVTIAIVCASNLLLVLSKVVKYNVLKTWILLSANVMKYLGIIICIIKICSACGADTTSLVTGAGVLTLIVGLGCQSIVADIVSGIFIMLEGKFLINDVVVIGGWRGTVQQIGLRTTSIMDAAGNIKIINNSNISDIINNTKAPSLSVIDVGIEYDESLEKVEKILSENFEAIKKQIPDIIDGPYYKGVSSLGESSVNIRIVAHTSEANKYQVERDLNRAVKLLFDKYNINIPYNQLVLSYRESNDTADVDARTKHTAKTFVEEQKEASRGLENVNS